MNTVYRHYGHAMFQPEYLRNLNIERCLSKNKPNGLWSSPLDSSLCWYNWCTDEEFHVEKLSTYFDFTLKESAKILCINSYIDLQDAVTRFPGDVMDEHDAFLIQ